MVTKSYCDICNKEVKLGSFRQVKISDQSIGEISCFYEVCGSCAKKIKDFIENERRRNKI